MDGRSRVVRVKVESGQPDEIKYNLEDHLGNASFTMNEAGSLINREEYFPFGETSFGSYLIKRYRFCGKERDEESGLYYYGARYYACWSCRFVSIDPLAGEYPFYTPYQYAGNRPINFIDLDGLEPGGGMVEINPGTNSSSQTFSDPPGFSSPNRVETTISVEYRSEGEKLIGRVSGTTINYVDGIPGSPELSFDTGEIRADASPDPKNTILHAGLKLIQDYRAGAVIPGTYNSQIRTGSYLPELQNLGEQYRPYSTEQLARTDPATVAAQARKAFDARNGIRSKMQNRLTGIGRLISEKIEGDNKATFEALEASKKRKNPKLVSDTDVHNDILRSASSSNAKVNSIVKWGGRAGKILLVLGVLNTSRRLYTAGNGTSGESLSRAAVEEWGTWSGAIGGAEAGAALGLVVAFFFPEATVAIVLTSIVCGAILGYWGGKWGGGAANWLYDFF